MPTNFYMYFVAGLIPMFVGAIYYHDKLFGGVWKNTNGFTDEFLAEGNMPKIFGLAYLFSVILSFGLTGAVIHQTQIFGLLVPEVFEAGSQVAQDVSDFMSKYGDRHRTFSHGFVHGIFLTVFFVWPLIAINSLFERRSWKYIAIHVGYWLITLALMGGLLCSTLAYAEMP